MKGLNFAIWGLSFKPNTDDIREAPSIDIVKNLLDNHAKVSVNDPAALNNFKNLFGDKVQYFENNFDALNDANCLIINTEWSIYRQPDFNTIKERMKDKVIFDGRNLYNPKKLKSLGFYYSNVGYSPKDE